jgi:hypothetical protein
MVTPESVSPVCASVTLPVTVVFCAKSVIDANRIAQKLSKILLLI